MAMVPLLVRPLVPSFDGWSPDPAVAAPEEVDDVRVLLACVSGGAVDVI